MYMNKYKFSIVIISTTLACYLAYAILDYSLFIQQYRSKTSDNTRLLLVWGNGVGEREQTHRFKIAANNIGIDLKVVSAKETQYLPNIFSHKTIHDAAQIMQPHIILTIERGIPAIKVAPNYLVLDQSEQSYLVQSGEKTRLLKKLYDYYGLLPTFAEIEHLENYFKVEQHIFKGFVWYPTVYRTNYINKPPSRVFYPGGILKDKTRSSDKYKSLFKILDDKSYMEIRGNKAIWKHTPKSVQKPAPFDGKSLLKMQNEAGVSLILHDEEHLNNGIPTGRIFEAAAANTIIISDQHKFIIDNFGENVLYIDVSNNSEHIAQQIDDHMQWINQHPIESAQMAQNCHNIFIEKFTLEDQLKHLLEMHAKYNNDQTKHI